MVDAKLRKAAIQIRDSLNAAVTDATAFIRVLDEIIEMSETPTVRPPSGEHEEVALPKVDIVKLGGKGRNR